MAKTIVTIILAAVLFISGCNMEKKSAVPQTFSNVGVRVSSSPEAKFPKGSKYAFIESASDSELTPEAAMIKHRIKTALTTELKKKGYKPGETGDVDFMVACALAVQHEVEVLMAESKEKGNEWMVAIVTPNDYVTGALLVEMIDAKTMKPVWLGAFNADVTLTSVSEKEKQERVTYAVHELLREFPPK